MTLNVLAQSDPARAKEVLSEPLGFGSSFADLMVVMRFRDGSWETPTLEPFAPLSISPAAKVLHYGQEIFEGHKAYRRADGEVVLFRHQLNAERFNRSAARMCMETVPVPLQMQMTEQFVDAVRAWVPTDPESTLYLRPTLLGMDSALGVSASKEFLYLLLASPVGAYFPNGFASVSVVVEPELVRAALGGVGDAKTGGNYAAGLAAQERAKRAGFDQVMFLDAKEHRYIDELAAMNVLIVRDGALLTPPLGTILDGITRRSLMELAPMLGLRAEATPLAIEEVIDDARRGRVTEMFACGTAAVVTPIGTLGYDGDRFQIGDGEPGPITTKLYERLTGIQYGRIPDKLGWTHTVS